MLLSLTAGARAARSGLAWAAGQWESLVPQQLWPPSSRSFGSSSSDAASDSMSVATLPADKRRALVNMMLYRAKQRGFLELDLLMGKYAEKNIRAMSDHKLLAFNALLLEENPDLFKWLTGQLEPPPEVSNNEAFKDLRGGIASQVSLKAHDATVVEPGKEWVRGWSDAGTELSSSSE